MFKKVNIKNILLSLGLCIIILDVSTHILYAQAEDEEAVELNTYEENLKVWQSLSDEERQSLREKANALKEMPVEKKEEIREKFHNFKKLPSEKRQEIRENAKHFSQMPQEKRNILKERVSKLERLPKERRENLRRQARPGISKPESPKLEKRTLPSKKTPTNKEGFSAKRPTEKKSIDNPAQRDRDIGADDKDITIKKKQRPDREKKKPQLHRDPKPRKKFSFPWSKS